MEPPDEPVVISRILQQKFTPHMYALWMVSRMRPWRGVPRAIGLVWRLHQRGYVATCVLWNHPDGLELRLTVDSTPSQTGIATTPGWGLCRSWSWPSSGRRSLSRRGGRER